MIVIGIDPGPLKCGFCVYDTDTKRVTESRKDASVDDVLDTLFQLRLPCYRVGIERVQSYGIAGGDLLRTSEVVGRLWQQAIGSGYEVTLHYRRDVLRFLDVTGKGSRDALVRARLIEMHGGTREAAMGKKASPGPLYGVSSHAWSALAVALTAADGVDK